VAAHAARPAGRLTRALALVAAATVLVVGLPHAALAEGPGPCKEALEGCTHSDGNAYQVVVSVPGLHHGSGSSSGGGGCVGCEWSIVPACWVNGPDNGADALCGAAIHSCRGDGLLMWVFVRRPREAWDRVATTCIGPSDPVVTLADVRAHAAQLYRDRMRPGAATISPRPVNGPWVVNLTSYFEATGAGPRHETFGPPEVRVAIDATPTYVWDWGDGSEPFETTSAGGPYPTGDVTHVYRHHGARTVTLTTRWSATFTVVTALGTFGPYPVPGAPIAPMTTTRIRVQEGRADLVSGGR
jgi:hypothetical protein